jgi:threonine synthase
MAQIVYYIYAACALGAPARKVNFCVPTGNFGDIYAGFLARKMGLPMGRLIIASNRNDILTRCVQTGIYAAHGVKPSHSPSMDIQISSNFERLLFDLYDRDSAQINALMQQFRDTGSITLSAVAHRQLQAIFSAHAVDDAATLQTMQQCYADCGYLPDPHTAVGLAAAHACAQDCGHGPIVTLATAHPAKFPEALAQAGLPNATLPAHLADLYMRPERLQNLANDYNQLTTLIGNL